MEIVLSVLVAILSIALIAVVLMQDGKDQGLGALAGNTDSYLNKTGKDGKSLLVSSTKWIALAWLLAVLGMSFIH
ncbi:MAG: preprotein translocase subunit SecG [Oscillospiraceae bacterium]|nr:preprotein translocase subunit SecG [Oscillospiraceae bacterium]